MLMKGKNSRFRHFSPVVLIQSFTHSPGLRKLSETNKMTSMHSSEKAHAVGNSFNNQHICVTAPFFELSKVNKRAELFVISLQ